MNNCTGLKEFSCRSPSFDCVNFKHLSKVSFLLVKNRQITKEIAQTIGTLVNIVFFQVNFWLVYDETQLPNSVLERNRTNPFKSSLTNSITRQSNDIREFSGSNLLNRHVSAKPFRIVFKRFDKLLIVKSCWRHKTLLIWPKKISILLRMILCIFSPGFCFVTLTWSPGTSFSRLYWISFGEIDRSKGKLIFLSSTNAVKLN